MKKGKNLKKNSIFTNKKRFYGFVCMVLLLMISLSGTIAYYRFGANGTITASTATYNFNITSDAISNTKINLGSNLKPYDKGSFNVNVNMPDTSSDAQYSINIERVSLPDGFKFLAADDNVSPFNNYTKYFNAADTKTDSVTIYWYWDGSVSDENDSLFIGKTISANLVLKSRTVNGADMKNGYSSDASANGGTEFWNDTYRPYIRTITFQNNLSNLPGTCNEANLCWDISASTAQTKKVYGYLIDSGLKDKTDSTKTLYNLYIVSDYEIMAPTDCYKLFGQFTNLVSINFNDLFNTVKTQTMLMMFTEDSSLVNLDLSSFNTTAVENIGAMFDSCTSLQSVNISSFDTSNVLSLHSLFYGCSSLKSINVSNLNTTKAANFSAMFGNCSKLSLIDLSSFNTSQATSLVSMFSGCTSLTSLDISNFNTSKVTSMNAMFWKCSSLTSLDLSNFNTSKVTDMSIMFSGCTNLSKLDLGIFDTSSLTNMSYMFNNCAKLSTKIKISNANITEYTDAFKNSANVGSATIIVTATDAAKTITASIVATKNAIDNVVFDDGTPTYMKDGFNSDDALKTEIWKPAYRDYIRTITFTDDLSKKPNSCTEANRCFDISYSSTQNAKVFAYMIDSGYKDSSNNTLYNLYIASPLKIYAPVNSTALLYSFTNVVAINFNDYFDTSKVENMKFMFQKLTSLTSLDLSTINTSSATNMEYLFSYLESMKTLDLSTIDTSNATSISHMFWASTGLVSLDLSGFNTSKVTNMSGMFRDCSNLASLNIKNLDTSKVTNLDCIFYNCSSLTNLDLSNFDTTSVTNFNNAFNGCTKMITTITIRTTNGTHANVFTNAATVSGSKITVNYSNGKYSKASSMVSTKTSGANVVLGKTDDSVIGADAVTMMKNGYTVNSSGSYSLRYFWQYKDYIRNINIKDNLTNKPNNCTESTKCWDISYASNQSAKVYAWLEISGSDSSGNTLYRLTIASTEKIYAPADSSYMFSNFGNLLGISIANDSFDTSKVTNYNYMFKDTRGVNATLTIRSANATCTGMFTNAALTSENTGVGITLNYTSVASSLVDKMILTKSTNSKITKGSVVS